MNKADRNRTATDAMMDQAFKEFGFAQARSCDKAVVKAMGGTAQQLVDLMVDHWRLPRRSVETAVLKAINLESASGRITVRLVFWLMLATLWACYLLTAGVRP